MGITRGGDSLVSISSQPLLITARAFKRDCGFTRHSTYTFDLGDDVVGWSFESFEPRWNQADRRPEACPPGKVFGGNVFGKICSDERNKHVRDNAQDEGEIDGHRGGVGGEGSEGETRGSS